MTQPARPHPRLPFLAAVLVLTLASCEGRREPAAVAAGGSASEIPRHLFLITVDTLRADHTSLHGYPRATTPRLDAVAAGGMVFERAIAQWPKTGASFASLFSGRYPQSTGLTHKAALSVPESIVILPEVLRERGFTTVAVISNPVLSRQLGWDRGYDEYVEVWGEGLTDDPTAFRAALWAGRVNDAAFEVLRRHSSAERLFAWIHYSDPHAPYVLPAGVDNEFLGDPVFASAPQKVAPVLDEPGKAIGEHDDLRFYVAQYDANVEVVDRHVAALLVLLDEELELLDQAAVVFTADHGESLGEHDLFFEHGPLPYNTASHVPLAILGPSVPAGARVTPPVELLDLFPTLLDWILPGEDLEVRALLEGESLWPLMRGGGSPADAAGRLAFADAGRGRRHFRTVQDERFKAIYRPARGGRTESIRNWELYDLLADPLETRNLAAADHPELARLRRSLVEWMREPAATAPVAPKSEQELRALRALGYVDEAGDR
ncbi:MAG TPA: sulfatase [Thermoanaerobaculia bacterium]|nr:sulfatase [Thermoanaerobaculia bacterium]